MVLILISLFVIEVVVAAALGLGIYYFQFLPTADNTVAVSSSADGLLQRTVATSDQSGTLPLFQSLFGTANYTSNGSSSPLIITTAGKPTRRKCREAMTSV